MAANATDLPAVQAVFTHPRIEPPFSLEELRVRLIRAEERAAMYRSEAARREQEARDHARQVEAAQAAVAQLQTQLAGTEQWVQIHRAQLAEKEALIQEQLADKEALLRAQAVREQEAKTLQAQLADRERLLQDRHLEIQRRAESDQNGRAEADRHRADNQALRARILSLENWERLLTFQVEALEAQAREWQRSLEAASAREQDLQAELQEAAARERDLREHWNAMRHSRAWRLAALLSAAARRVAPPGTWRRKVLLLGR
jgi:chromosome segregation ATPase